MAAHAGPRSTLTHTCQSFVLFSLSLLSYICYCCICCRRLPGKGLVGELPDVLELDSLQVLDLSGNELEGPLPKNLTLPSLRLLNLQDNGLSGGWVSAGRQAGRQAGGQAEVGWDFVPCRFQFWPFGALLHAHLHAM